MISNFLTQYIIYYYIPWLFLADKVHAHDILWTFLAIFVSYIIIIFIINISRLISKNYNIKIIWNYYYYILSIIFLIIPILNFLYPVILGVSKKRLKYHYIIIFLTNIVMYIILSFLEL